MKKKFSDMPNLDLAIKKQVSMGNIALFFQKDGFGGNKSIQYVLHIMNNVNYLLDSTGNIVSVSPNDDYDKTDLVLFEG